MAGFDLDAEIKKQYGNLADEYNTAKQGYEQAQAKEVEALDIAKTNSMKTQTDALNRAMNEAYINKRTTERDMPGMLATQGISGGASETAISSNNRNYQNARNTANTGYTTNKANIDTQYNADAATIGSRYAQMLTDLEKQKMNDAYARAQGQYQVYAAEEQARLQREQLEFEKQMREREFALQQQALAAQQAAASRSYSSGSSGGGSTSEKETYTPTGDYWVGGKNRYVQETTKPYIDEKAYSNYMFGATTT